MSKCILYFWGIQSQKPLLHLDLHYYTVICQEFSQNEMDLFCCGCFVLKCNDGVILRSRSFDASHWVNIHVKLVKSKDSIGLAALRFLFHVTCYDQNRFWNRGYKWPHEAASNNILFLLPSHLKIDPSCPCGLYQQTLPYLGVYSHLWWH